jgi:ubiquinone/menaquinone biosynthesis C-methylase UbiE
MQTKGYKGLGMKGPIARWYAKITYQDLDEFKALAKRMSKQLADGAGVLEVAPGPGYFAVELAKLGNYKITGLDVSDTFVQIARKNAQEAGVQVDFRLGNASELPFASDSFDLVVCRAAFKNFTEPAEAMREMRRVLRPGGRAVIIDLRKDTSKQEIDAHFETGDRRACGQDECRQIEFRVHQAEFPHDVAQTGVQARGFGAIYRRERIRALRHCGSAGGT